MTSGHDDREHLMMLSALASFSDSCTLPDLTPECPYFEKRDGAAPTCGEQCRDALARHGVPDRHETTVQLGGLVLHGRAVPSRAASGAAAYDAGQIYIEDRHKPLGVQRTAALMLALKAGLTHPHNPLRDAFEDAMPLWAELDRRGIPVERVIRAGIIPDMAQQVSAFASLPAVAALFGASFETRDTLQPFVDLSQRTWHPLLQATVTSTDDAPSILRRVLQGDHRSHFPSSTPGVAQQPSEEQRRVMVDQLKSGRGPAAEALFARSPNFQVRVRAWLNDLVEGDVHDLYRWAHPAEPIFVNLGLEPQADAEARWIWDRFAETDFASWASQSLVLEWRHGQSGSDTLPSRVSRERVIPREGLPDVLMTQLADRPTLRRTPGRITADRFVRRATQLLHAGEMDSAADIFSALVDMAPTDGAGHNNLGFCLIPTDPARALAHLEQASVLPEGNKPLSEVNRALALHRLRRDPEALSLARLAQANVTDPLLTVTMWEPDENTCVLRLAERAKLGPYIDAFVAHLERPCTAHRVAPAREDMR